jgi:hypothetical protein
MDSINRAIGILAIIKIFEQTTLQHAAASSSAADQAVVMFMADLFSSPVQVMALSSAAAATAADQAAVIFLTDITIDCPG